MVVMADFANVTPCTRHGPSILSYDNSPLRIIQMRDYSHTEDVYNMLRLLQYEKEADLMDATRGKSDDCATNRHQSRRPNVLNQFLGPLPKAFIITGFLNFLVGSAFGGAMAVNPSWIPILLRIHEEVNPYGWLTMMIYGMTFAVLALFAGLKPRWRWLGWSQWAAAEFGVITIALASFTALSWVRDVGVSLQALAPILFLANILSGVAAARKQSDEQGNLHRHRPSKELLQSVDSEGKLQALLQTPPDVETTDKIAQRGTDIALLVFVAAEFLFLYSSFFSPGTGSLTVMMAAQGLVYYGWIAGTVLAVALHLYPRYSGFASITRWQAAVGQALWLVGSILIGVSTWLGVMWNDWGIRCIGLSIAWFALSYLLTMRHAFHPLSTPTGTLWWAAWLVALILGIHLALGSNAYTPLSLHLLFLGWVTSLVYGIGYTFFPVLLQRRLRYLWLARLQTWTSLAGFSLMATAFTLSDAPSLVLLAIGGTLAALGAWVFLLQWVVLGVRTANHFKHLVVEVFEGGQ